LKFWWLVNSRRLGAERRGVECIAAEEGWFDLDRWCFHEGRLAAVGTIIAHDHRYPVRLVYPDQFPEVPAWVEPQEEVRWSTHQFGSGTLCLQLRPDNWIASATGADVLRSAYNLLVTEDPLGKGDQHAPSAHNVGELQAYDWGENPVLMSAACQDRIRRGEARDIKALRWMVADDLWPILVHDADDRVPPRHPPGADINTWRFEVPVFVSSKPAPAVQISRAELIAAGAFDMLTAMQLAGSAAGLVLFAGGDEMVAYNLLAEGDLHRRRIFVLAEETGIRSGRADAAKDKKVAIIGAGSVGSKLAESLLRSGICRFTLVDGDVLLPANLERHALDWRDVSFRKVNGLKRRLLHITPGAEIDVVDANLNWQRSARTHAWQVESIAGCDVIVDATGDVATALFLGAIADVNDRPFVSVEVFEGGIGGLVATSLPKRDPPFATGRAAFLAWCDEQRTKPPEPGPGRYEALSENGAPLVADDATVTMTAGHAARVVLDILEGNPAPVTSAWLLFGYARAWLFDGHGHTIRLSVGERSGNDTTEEDPDAKEFALKLFEEWLSENSTPS
jgi:ThiF family